jgi:hypothetical protein
LYPRRVGHHLGVTDQEYDEQTHPEQDDLLEEQGNQREAIGEDEGDRDEPVPDE